MANISRFTATFLCSWALGAIVLAGAGLAAPSTAVAQAAAPPAKQTNSPKVGKILKDVQEDIKNKNSINGPSVAGK